MSANPRFCPRCGNPLRENARFCASCGEPLAESGTEGWAAPPAQGTGAQPAGPGQPESRQTGSGFGGGSDYGGYPPGAGGNYGNYAPPGAGAASGTGLAPNVAAALSYLAGAITGIVFVLTEKDNFVRFHAFQSIIASVVWIVAWVVFTILSTILTAIPLLGILAAIIGFFISIGLWLAGVVVWIVLMIKAYQGQRWHLPYIGEMAERYAASDMGRRV